MARDTDGKEEKGALRVDQTSLMGEGFSFSGYERDPLYLNLGGEGKKRFTDISGVSGIDSITDGRAGVFADFDNDGDTDVFMTTIQGQSHLLFRNNVGSDNNTLRVKLEGDDEIGRDAFGSIVRVKTSAGTLTKIKDGGSGFISQHDPRLLFGLGKDSRAESIEVTWSNGERETFDATAAKAGTFVLLRKGAGSQNKNAKPIEIVAIEKASLPDPLTRAESFARGLKIRVGAPLPRVALKTIAGEAKPLNLQLQPGRKTLLNLWATWCVPCRAEMPELDRLRPLLAKNSIDLVGLNVDSDSEADVRGFLRDNPVKYPVLIGGVNLIERVYATDQLSVPLSILVDERGIVSEIIPGWSAETRARFAQLAGTTTETEAADADAPRAAPTRARRLRSGARSRRTISRR